MVEKKYLGALCIFLFFIILPSSFALNEDNLTVSDENSILEVPNLEEDTLSRGEDYYFNASADEDGIGSLTSPYKYLTADRMVDGSVIHLANGEYEFQ